jgi:hypothetical protein
MRFLIPLCLMLLAGCGQREFVAPPDNTPLARHLEIFSEMQNRGDWEGLRSHFTKNAKIQSPATPQTSGVESYLQAIAKDPYTLQIHNTENIYSFPGRAMTRSDVTVKTPGRPALRERLAVDWEFEDNYWRIAKMVYSDWSSIIGRWRRSGLRQEGSIELRVLPGGRYVVYTADDYSVPAFKGDYRLEGNRITFSDVSSYEASLYQNGEGRYSFVRTPTGMTLGKLREENTWRDARYEGAWSPAN